jgi:hypothetical protein
MPGVPQVLFLCSSSLFFLCSSENLPEVQNVLKAEMTQAQDVLGFVGSSVSGTASVFPNPE